jgi:formylmethanofuran dehydrogenase subunit E
MAFRQVRPQARGDDVNEPLIHSHITDELPEEHYLSNQNVECSQCGVLVHFCTNECMQTWIEMDGENLCTVCFGKRDMKVLP